MDVRAVEDLSSGERTGLFTRDAGIAEVRESVEAIIDQVREEGDAALRSFASEFDEVDVGPIEVTGEAERAVETVDDEVQDAIETAAANIRRFHERQLPADWRDEFEGRELGRRYRPLERVGVYTPGGTAAYPSSALMGIIPATIAGVDHVAVATPPAETLNSATLAAIHIAGADTVYQIGGAQSIAALAYGTETVSPVQKVVGPGNKWVTAAKAVVHGDVDIDFLAGPSELLVICDNSANPEWIAADMVAQAEHDPNAAVVCVTDVEAIADSIAAACIEQAEKLPRSDVILSAFENEASGVFVARSMSEAVLFAEEYAAEHLSIVATESDEILDRIDSAGSVFLGEYSPVAAGDYAAGPNHILPTGGRAKVAGGLSVEHFLRSSTVQRLDRAGLASLRETVTTLAENEGFTAHAASIERRFTDDT